MPSDLMGTYPSVSEVIVRVLVCVKGCLLCSLCLAKDFRGPRKSPHLELTHSDWLHLFKLRQQFPDVLVTTDTWLSKYSLA